MISLMAICFPSVVVFHVRFVAERVLGLAKKLKVKGGLLYIGSPLADLPSRVWLCDAQLFAV